MHLDVLPDELIDCMIMSRLRLGPLLSLSVEPLSPLLIGFQNSGLTHPFSLISGTIGG